jgi:hypothetical protein
LEEEGKIPRKTATGAAAAIIKSREETMQRKEISLDKARMRPILKRMS